MVSVHCANLLHILGYTSLTVQLAMSAYKVQKCIILFRYNIITVGVLGLFNIPNIGTQWLSYVLPVGCFAVIPLFMTVKEEYNRRLVDEY